MFFNNIKNLIIFILVFSNIFMCEIIFFIFCLNFLSFSNIRLSSNQQKEFPRTFFKELDEFNGEEAVKFEYSYSNSKFGSSKPDQIRLFCFTKKQFKKYIVSGTFEFCFDFQTEWCFPKTALCFSSSFSLVSLLLLFLARTGFVSSRLSACHHLIYTL